MLEIRNVTKIYKTKGGVLTKALDDVSITFAETGLVFLLGKSGSGKSTLLNVSGGLDDPTEGEIIVKGKSSKDFSGADFDSYRNTFVGFVFQEYNVLDEFNVEDNIALALELQGKPKDRAKINALLEEVDLKDYAKRKPNTLSGGQKQRIAIARALIKDPQIIMADEPTGALDSATGKQVFDTLKKLSQTRLVIVVSHDREFAEMYGDRIVELKDGKIISDVTKRSIAPEQLDKNLSLVGGDTLTIKSGASLTKQNIAAINEFLTKSQGDIIITRGEKELSAFRKANRMTESGNTESFSATVAGDVSIKEYTKEDSKFIRSRLPAGKAIKIGASGLKLKPVRLVFTIFLSFVAFVMFGLFSTLMTYNGDSVAANSFAIAGGDYINIDKKAHYRYVYDDGSVDEYEWYSYYAKFTPAEVEKFKDEFGDGVFATIGRQNTGIGNAKVNADVSSDYYQNAINKYTQVEKGKHVLSLIAGNYPEQSNEIVLSSYIVNVLKNSEFYLLNENGYYVDANGDVVDDAVTFNVTDAKSLIGKYVSLSLGGTAPCFKVVGVFDSGEIDSKYDDIRDGTLDMNSASGYMHMYEYGNYLTEGLHELAIVNDDFNAKYGLNLGYDSTPYYEEFDYIASGDGLHVYVGDEGNNHGGEFWAVQVYSEDALYNVEFIWQSKTSLADDEIIVPFSIITDAMWYLHAQIFDKSFEDENPYPNIDDYVIGDYVDEKEYNQAVEQWQYECDAWIAAQTEMYNQLGDKITWCEWIFREGQVYDEEIGGWVKPTAEQVDEAIEFINSFLAEYSTDGYIPAKISQGDTSGKNFKIVGWFFNDGSFYCDDGFYVSQSYYKSLDIIRKYYYGTQQTNYVAPKDAIYDGIYIPYDHTVEGFRAILAKVGYKNLDTETDVFYEINSALYDTVEQVNSIAKTLSTVFLAVGLVFAIFASLLMFNFISMSISNKRKEIGILRAVGARGTDVFKIFFAESGIIMGICLVLSIIGSLIVSIVINNILRASLGLAVTIFVFGIVSILMMLALALVVALVSTFLPVYFAARKKPVESIRAL